MVDSIRSTSIELADHYLTERIPDGGGTGWRDWAARLVPTVTLEAVIAWLDTGQPEPDRAAEHIRRAIESVIDVAHPADGARQS